MIFLESVDSTHKYLKEYIKTHGYFDPLAIISRNQTDGIGSRDNNWEGEEGNLFFSFVLHENDLPFDLPVQSASIYFSFILKELLSKMGSSLWLKWPNDFYLQDKKIGGTITHCHTKLFYCGIGINLQKNNQNYGYLDINIDVQNLLTKYFSQVEKKIEWKKIFSKYRIEFKNSKDYKTTIGKHKVALKDAVLNEDGSINISDEKVFSLR